MKQETPKPRTTLAPIGTLIGYARNARTHSQEQIAGIAGSIAEFGFVGAIVIRDGVIAKGHGTLAAVRMLAEAGKQIHPAPGKSAGMEPFPAGMIPVQDCTGWTDSQFRAYVIADNRHAELAGWDTEMLALELEDLRLDGFDLDLTGFDADAIDAMMGQAAGQQDDSAPASSAKEINPDNYEMGRRCPRCGFEFDDKEA